MKLIAFVALVAVAAAQEYVKDSDREATVVKSFFEQAQDESFVSDVETSNGIFIKAYGESVPGPEPETGDSIQEGSYEYTAPNGQQIRVEWKADKKGFRATSDVIPEGADGQAAASGQFTQSEAL